MEIRPLEKQGLVLKSLALILGLCMRVYSAKAEGNRMRVQSLLFSLIVEDKAIAWKRKRKRNDMSFDNTFA